MNSLRNANATLFREVQHTQLGMMWSSAGSYGTTMEPIQIQYRAEVVSNANATEWVEVVNCKHHQYRLNCIQATKTSLEFFGAFMITCNFSDLHTLYICIYTFTYVCIHLRTVCIYSNIKIMCQQCHVQRVASDQPNGNHTQWHSN